MWRSKTASQLNIGEHVLWPWGGRADGRATALPTVAAVAALMTSAVIGVLLLVGGDVASASSGAPKLSHACDGCPQIFRSFADDTGMVRSATNDRTLDASNAFFAEDLGKNATACYDCHQPRQGYSIQVPFIRSQFDTTNGTDSVFATNDTANRPDADTSTLAARQAAFGLFLDIGVVRIGKSQKAGDFTVASQNTPTFGLEPKPSCPNNDLKQTSDCDPQGLGSATLSLFRRPLVNTNVFFDSAVLWDGRASIDGMDAQAKKAAQTLLLSETCDTPVSPATCTPTITAAQEHDIARFMTGVFTAQDVDTAAGHLDALDASGGVRNLAARALDPGQPCRSSAGTLTVFTPATCTPASSPAMTLFDAWPGSARLDEGRKAARAAVVRGQALFNGGAHLHVPGVGTAACASCHALNDLGNNPSDTSAVSFVRLGLDSPDFVARLAAEDGRLSAFAQRTGGLPVYSVAGGTCPQLADPLTGAAVTGTNVRTTDPGRAMVTGQCADLGKFKPPLLRDVAVRGPYFHNAAAATLDDVVNFYNARFTAGLTAAQRADLVAFLKTL